MNDQQAVSCEINKAQNHCCMLQGMKHSEVFPNNYSKNTQYNKKLLLPKYSSGHKEKQWCYPKMV